MKLRAVTGKAIVTIKPNPQGAIVRPERWERDGDEGQVVHDNTGLGLKQGARVLVSHKYGDGTYFEMEGKRYCAIRKAGLLMTEEGAWT